MPPMPANRIAIPPPQPHQCTPATTTVVTIVGISCKRTFELCPSCAPACTLQKLAVIIEADRKECWIAASFVDIATVGAGGKWLGCRYRVDSQKRPWWQWRKHGEGNVEKQQLPSQELMHLAEVLMHMARELRCIELRLCRGRSEVVH
jgi:hypothetical protein